MAIGRWSLVTGPILMARAFDATGSYEAVLVRLAVGILGISTLLLALPAYDSLRTPSVP